ncbi:hypothetical protein BST81_23075 [Leptolyngbya sp. 'hensonii']|uniref:DUF948 domain-containing protein n=1 Tax=Leptolyngbya sp. 'hensonii' TaxID=1922337 RepID=UPI00094F6D6B|nr:DUF948 domain-containing protein [Leptolyngbya sp. 'hensonii']OLP16109.1 hypothetical protein BST81_23075 [Leptolyngbya sp. 'hensonii']
MIDPVFFLGLSILLVAISLTAVLVVLIPAVLELARAARSAEKLFDTLSRDLPPTLEAIRLTGMEISDLTDDMSEGVRNAGQVVKRVDQSLDGARKQAQRVQVTTRSVFAGVKAAWRSFTRPAPGKPANRRSTGRLAPSYRPSVDLPADAPGYPEYDVLNDPGESGNLHSAFESSDESEENLLSLDEVWADRPESRAISQHLPHPSQQDSEPLID